MTINTNETITQEGAERCLTCRKAKCTNCLKYLVPKNPNTYIQQFDLKTGRLDGEYDTVLDAAEATGMAPSRIMSAFNGKNSTGSEWKLAGTMERVAYFADSTDGTESLVFRTKSELCEEIGVVITTLRIYLNKNRPFLSHKHNASYTFRSGKVEVPVE
jgi:hypothetical protein